ncbi:GUN4 domain-containing protein [Anabaena aphanizomenioides LEGE 00250]|uniref:GUN4 domain-containing protein n=1 Tax=Sphaerospermopsis aphanizomenoides LEGE 00250 TaxID=2777972 RepID=A0ABR9VDK2_9CYAN|nr:tetratricopeptide repeat protein [Sphaerospermopsis aphanizomenoides]MBE9236573.1 GUN4 domain-containing protein [Sphaerospermopsis aphanizomenoides LEGE 00250]
MDWITILKAQQTDFIARIKSGDLLHCEKEGQHSELTVISGERLKQLRDFCWEMANKFKQQYDVKNIFFNNMKGKLGEEVVKIRLGDFVTEVDYEKYSGGDGKVDFTLTSDSSIGIQVKTRYGNYDQVQWTIDKEEIEKNAVLVCVLCQEEFSDIEKEYRLIMVGFLPTNMIKSAVTEAIVRIDELLYPGGLRGYLENLKLFTSYDYDKYIRLGDEFVNNEDYQGAILVYSHALYLRSNEAITYYEKDAIMAIICFKIGNTHSTLGDYKSAINNYTRSIHLHPMQFAVAYENRGNAYYTLGEYQDAINDYTQAINLNLTSHSVYENRGNAYYTLEKYQDAIYDYTQAIKLNPTSDNAYYKRGISHKNLGKYQNAINDYTQVIHLNPEFAGAYCNRGNTYKVLQKYTNAINDYTQAINLDPEFAIAYYNRGVIYKESRKYKDAINDFSQVINLEPKFAIAYYNRGSVNLILGNKQSAIDDFNKAVSIYKQENNFHDYHKTLEELKNIQCDNIELKSAVGMSYTHLRDLLKAGKWKEADEETYRVMLAVAKREKKGWLDVNSINNFPCPDLRIIDQLWVKYSNGKFGFSVQKRIYHSYSGTRGYNREIWEKFGDKVGWRKRGNWLYYNDITFDIKAPEGHLPLRFGEVVGVVRVFSRVETCKL